ncbi:MAG: FTR1 family protein, partial [Bacteroidia bacterium]|nr:FTR1 family protein [Bacteroidia bacterium]MDW8332748.1 FTR1 family protein [Bacteroidia bacterium]
MNEFVVVFRETLEAALIVGIIGTTLVKLGRRDALRGLWRGVALAVAAAAILGGLLHTMGRISQNKAWMAGFEAVLLFVTAGLLFYMVFWMAKRRNIGAELSQGTRDALLAGGASLTMFVFFVAFREGVETALFLFSVTKMQGGLSLLAATSGALAAALIAYLMFLQGKKISLKPFFRWTSAFLLVLGAGMAAYGVHETEECLVALGLLNDAQIPRPYIWFPPLSEAPSMFYDRVGEKYIHWLHDKGRIGQ